MPNSPYRGQGFRRGVAQFLSGKALSAALTFAILLWLVRLLPAQSFGVYATLLAVIELGTALAGVGLPWLAARYLPEYRLKAPQHLAGQTRYLLVWQTAALLGFGLMGALVLGPYVRWAGLAAWRKEAALALVILATEGLARFYREAVLPALMRQGEARASMVGRQVSMLAGIALATMMRRADLLAVMAVELFASTVGLLIAAVLTSLHLRAVSNEAGSEGWREPGRAEQWSGALRMYLSQLLSLPYSAQVLTNLLQQGAGPAAVALFGFLRTLQEQLGRYLPATLLLSVLRPRLIADVIDTSPQHGGALANLVGKLSLFMLFPIVCIAALDGAAWTAFLSGHRLSDAGLLPFAMSLVLVPFSQRQLLETVAMGAGHASWCTVAALSGLIALPVALLVIALGGGAWGAALGLIVGHAAFCAYLMVRLHFAGQFRLDLQGWARLSGVALLTYALTRALGAVLSFAELGIPVVALGLRALIVFLVFGTIAFLIKPFSHDERARINKFIGREIFVW